MFADAGVYGQTSNGHAAAADYAERYGTRCATGVMQRKRYDKGFTDDDDDDNDAGYSRSTLVRSRRNRPPAASDSDTERQEKTLRTLRKSTSSTVLPSSYSTLQHAQKSEGDSSDSESTADASDATSRSGSDSGSDTEAYSEGSGPVKSARTTRSTSGGKAVVTNGHVSSYDGGLGAKYRTRNQGRRTVHYQEADSDMDYDGRDGRRTLERRRTEVGSRARLCRS